MATNLPSCFFIQILEQLLKFLVNFTLLKYVKSQRSYGFLITKELIFGFQIFSASLTLFLLGGGGGGEIHPPSGFSSITQKREKIFSSNLVTFFIDKWVIIFTIKLEDRPFHVVMVMAQIKGAQK